MRHVLGNSAGDSEKLSTTIVGELSKCCGGCLQVIECLASRCVSIYRNRRVGYIYSALAVLSHDLRHWAGEPPRMAALSRGEKVISSRSRLENVARKSRRRGAGGASKIGLMCSPPRMKG